jgi:hypothetical protein
MKDLVRIQLTESGRDSQTPAAPRGMISDSSDASTDAPHTIGYGPDTVTHSFAVELKG